MKTTQRGFIIPLLLIIAAILLAGGGAYFYTQNKSENSPVTENITLPQATSTATTNQTTPVQTSNSKTEGWKTYTDPIFDFEIKYPSSWFQSIHGASLVLSTGDLRKGDTRAISIFPDGSKESKFIVYDNVNNDVSHEIISTLKFTSLGVTFQTVTASPTISSIEVVEGLPTGSVYAGQTAEIFGTDLRGVVSVKIGEQNVPVMTGVIADRALDTDQAFKVPSLPAGVYNVSVTNSFGQVSSVYPVTVVVYSPR